MGSISVSLSADEEAAIRSLASALGEDEETVVRRALREGLRTLRTEHAVQRYRAGEVSVNEAARVAGVSVAEWLEIARDHGLTSQLSPDDLARDAATSRTL